MVPRISLKPQLSYAQIQTNVLNLAGASLDAQQAFDAGNAGFG
jgi:hypothetical protein